MRNFFVWPTQGNRVPYWLFFILMIPSMGIAQTELSKNCSIPLYWWAPDGGLCNFGDALSPALIQRMAPRCTIQKVMTTEKKLLAIGSILHFASDGDSVWGSGVNGKHMNATDYHFRSLDVRAVRGPLTRRFLLKMGIPCPKIYGDPALLFPLFFPEFKKNLIRDYIIIPHISERDLFQGNPHVVLPTDPWKSIVQKIVESKLVISSSLHGLIIAEAFHIPARMLRITENEPLLKYRDYYLGTGRKSFRYATSVEEALTMGGEKPAHVDRSGLLRSCPFPISRKYTHIGEIHRKK